MASADKKMGQRREITEGCIGEYAIQPQNETGRAVTVPQAIDLEVGKSVTIWRAQSESGGGTQYLKFLRETDKTVESNESFVGQRSVAPNGEHGKKVTIPNDCCEKFSTGTKVMLSYGRIGDELVHMKAIPKQVYSETILAVVAD